MMKSIYKDSFRMKSYRTVQHLISTSPPAFPLLQLLTLSSTAHPCFRENKPHYIDENPLCVLG